MNPIHLNGFVVRRSDAAYEVVDSAGRVRFSDPEFLTPAILWALFQN